VIKREQRINGINHEKLLVMIMLLEVTFKLANLAMQPADKVPKSPAFHISFV